MRNNNLTHRARIVFGILIIFYSYTLLYLFFLFYPFQSDKMDMSDIDIRGEATVFCEVCYSVKDSKDWDSFVAKMRTISEKYDD